MRAAYAPPSRAELSGGAVEVAVGDPGSAVVERMRERRPGQLQVDAPIELELPEER